MDDTMTITATLVPVLTEISARPGDRLMLVGGKCIGVYTGAQKEAAPIPRRRAPKVPSQSTEEMVGKILEVLRDGPMTATALRGQLGPLWSDKGEWRMRDALKKLHTDGRITRTGPNVSRIYALREGAPA